MITATASVAANSRNNLPTMPPINRNWNEDGDQRDAHGQHGEANFLCTSQRGLQRLHSGFDVARDVFQNDDGVVDDNPVATVSAIKDKLSMLNPQRYMIANVPISDNGYRDCRNQRRPSVAQE